MKYSILLVALCVGLVMGCAGSKIHLSPALVQQGVASSVRYGTTKYPATVPAVKVGVDLVCSAANQTNISPSAVITGIQASSDWAALKTPESEFIMDGVLSFYTIAWNSYGNSAVSNSPALKLYLTAVCNGGHQGLPTQPGMMRRPGMMRGALTTAGVSDTWPHFK